MMNVSVRTFTKAEAQELVPVLTELFTEARTIVEELLARRHDAILTADVEGNVAVDDDSAFRIRQLGALLEARLALVTAMGLEIRRVDGLVDVPAFVNGEIGYFCWQFGDDTISEWHAAHEGCTERRPLDFRVVVGLH